MSPQHSQPSSELPADRIALAKSKLVEAVTAAGVKLTKGSAGTLIGCCPFHEEDGASFTVYLDPGDMHAHCYGGACGWHGTAIDFVMKRLGCSVGEAIDHLVGMPAAPAPRIKPKKKLEEDHDFVSPVPADAPKPSFWFGEPHNREPDAVWPYRDQAGAILHYVARWNLPGSKKILMPRTLWRSHKNGKLSWHWAGVPQGTPKPLYGLDRLAANPDATVLLVEGEKKVAAAEKLFPGFVVLSWMGGANAVDHADLAPLAGRGVGIWPDADEAGETAAGRLAARLFFHHGVIASVVVPPEDKLGSDWDLADALAEGWTPERAREHARAHQVTIKITIDESKIEVVTAEQRAARQAAAVGLDQPGPDPAAGDGPDQRPRDKRPEGFGKIDPDEPPPHEHAPEEYKGIPFTEGELALAFVETHGADRRYVAKWGQWYEWTGARWAEDTVLHSFDLAWRVCRQAAAIHGGNPATRIDKAKTVAGVAQLARSHPRIAATVAQWDRDPWLLNTSAGAIDLRGGINLGHRLDDYCTKMTAVAPGGECPLFLAFLNRIFADNGELIDFMQRFLGYGLTGVTHEQVFAFGHGDGQNGKGTLLNTVSAILGDYAAVAPMETFTDSKTERHPTELAMLRGKRLVTAQETRQGRYWDETKLKALTGGDPITARFMRQDFFTYLPQFKLFIAGNYKPRLRDVNEAIRRRLLLVPFSVKIPAAERDNHLSEKLEAERPGILAWLIEGCQHWQKIGLAPPPIVLAATEAYLASEDVVTLWLEECCVIDAQGWCSSSALFTSWKAWAEKASELVGSKKAFGQLLEDRGFRPKHNPAKTARGFTGLRLQTAAEMPLE